mmetsp:Transcript_21258/g.50002  ORF Transcript_21258/g.50002 Transcript_21258/m.50002 type:complete len:150 (-) Transcript_21258:58-507(-)
MVIKTERCFFTEMRMYPGHGVNFVRKDGKLIRLIGGKAAAMFHQHKKAQVIGWTQAWRRVHKKVRVDMVQRRAKKKSTKVQKSIEGVSIEELQKKRAQTAAFRAAARKTQIRAVKDRKASSKKTKTKVAKVNPVFARKAAKISFANKRR